MTHLKRLNSPASWATKRKDNIWITKPNSGPHNMTTSISLSFVLKELLNVAKTTNESKKILNSGKVLVNSIVRKDHKFPVGMFDIISLNNVDNFILFLNEKGYLSAKKIEANTVRPVKIFSKTKLAKNKTQLNFIDGTNLIVDKDNFKVGDTLIFDSKSKKVIEHLKLDKGSLVYLTKGKYIGKIAKVNKIIDSKISLKGKSGDFETLKAYAFVINKNFDFEK